MNTSFELSFSTAKSREIIEFARRLRRTSSCGKETINETMKLLSRKLVFVMKPNLHFG